MALPGIEKASYIVFEKAARHHHENAKREDPPTDFKMLFFATPDSLGVRIKISDELTRGTAVADVAVVYKWDRPATPDDDLDGFARSTAIPQVLSCASSALCDAAETVGAKAEFQGIQAIGHLITEFNTRERTLSMMLAQHVASRKKIATKRKRPDQS